MVVLLLPVALAHLLAPGNWSRLERAAPHKQPLVKSLPNVPHVAQPVHRIRQQNGTIAQNHTNGGASGSLQYEGYGLDHRPAQSHPPNMEHTLKTPLKNKTAASHAAHRHPSASLQDETHRRHSSNARHPPNERAATVEPGVVQIYGSLLFMFFLCSFGLLSFSGSCMLRSIGVVYISPEAIVEHSKSRNPLLPYLIVIAFMVLNSALNLLNRRALSPGSHLPRLPLTMTATHMIMCAAIIAPLMLLHEGYYQQLSPEWRAHRRKLCLIAVMNSAQISCNNMSLTQLELSMNQVITLNTALSNL